MAHDYWETADWIAYPVVKNFAWTQDTAGNTYMQPLDSYLNYGQRAQVQTRTVQARDIYGNLLQSQCTTTGT